MITAVLVVSDRSSSFRFHRARVEKESAVVDLVPAAVFAVQRHIKEVRDEEREIPRNLGIRLII